MEFEDIIDVPCPSCSPDEEVEHGVIKDNRVRCSACGRVHIIPVKKEKMIKVRVIVSRQDKSSVQETEMEEDEEVDVGDDMVVDAGDEVSGVRIQSIEAKTGGRVTRAKGKDITTLWARAIDEVVVKVAVQKGPETKSINYTVNGDFDFVVGDVIKVKGYEVRVTGIKVRDGAHYDREGKAIKAKDAKRVYSRIVAVSKTSMRGGPVSRTAGAFRKRPGAGPS